MVLDYLFFEEELKGEAQAAVVVRKRRRAVVPVRNTAERGKGVPATPT